MLHIMAVSLVFQKAELLIQIFSCMSLLGITEKTAFSLS